MTFIYTKEWEDELLGLYQAMDEGQDFDEKFDELIEIARNSDDTRVVQALIRCLAIQLEGVDQQVEGVLGSIDHDVYYEGVFQIVSDYFEFETDKNHGDFFSIQILSRGYTDKPPEYKQYAPSKDEVEARFIPIAKKYLSVEELKQFVSIMERHGYPKDRNIDIRVFFYELFKEIVMEAESR